MWQTTALRHSRKASQMTVSRAGKNLETSEIQILGFLKYVFLRFKEIISYFNHDL